MDADRFVSAMHEAFEGDPREAAFPRDRRLAPLRQRVRGFSSENVLMALNLAVQSCDPQEAYFEVGSLNGLTLYGAGLGNDRLLIAVDNFSREYEQMLDRIDGRPALYHHLETCMADLDVRFFERDCWRFINEELSDVLGARKIGVYFFDGPHDYDSQYRAIAVLEDGGFLADDALIFVDDANDDPVLCANRDWQERNRHYRLLFDLPSPQNGTTRGWWNGLQILRRHAPVRAATAAPG